MRIDLKGKIICCKGVIIISLVASLCFVFGHDTLHFQCFFSPRCINGKRDYFCRNSYSAPVCFVIPSSPRELDVVGLREKDVITPSVEAVTG